MSSPRPRTIPRTTLARGCPLRLRMHTRNISRFTRVADSMKETLRGHFSPCRCEPCERHHGTKQQITINTPTEDTKVTVLWKKTRVDDVHRKLLHALLRQAISTNTRVEEARFCVSAVSRGQGSRNCNPTRRDEHATHQCLQDIRSDSGPALRSLDSQAQFGCHARERHQRQPNTTSQP